MAPRPHTYCLFIQSPPGSLLSQQKQRFSPTAHLTCPLKVEMHKATQQIRIPPPSFSK